MITIVLRCCLAALVGTSPWNNSDENISNCKKPVLLNKVKTKSEKKIQKMKIMPGEIF